MKRRVLFLCTANSSRSQMAEGLVNFLWGDRFEACSAGTRATVVNPYAVETMQELGIDISGHRSKDLSEFDGQRFDYVVTLCGDANETCPLYVGGTKKRISVSMIRPRRPEAGRMFCGRSGACGTRSKIN